VIPGTGIHPRSASATSLKALCPEIDDSWSSLWYPTRKGEDLEELHARTASFADVFVPEAERRMPTHSRILLVSHAATLIALIRQLLGEQDLSLRLGCCALSDLQRKPGATVLGGWMAKTLATGDHLSQGLQRDWGFEDIQISDGKVCFRQSLIRNSQLTGFHQVISDHGVPGSEDEDEGPVGCQLPGSTIESHL
jgi:transcription factor C subunit 7